MAQEEEEEEDAPAPAFPCLLPEPFVVVVSFDHHGSAASDASRGFGMEHDVENDDDDDDDGGGEGSNPMVSHTSTCIR